jgi:uncharacterized protein
MKILCDQMLGSLATWLRFIGFDTFFTNGVISDQELLAIAKKEGRVLITRDKNLLAMAKKNHVGHIPIDTISLDEQLQKVLKNKTIEDVKVLSRCSLCNTTLKIIEKRNVINKIPPGAYEQYNLFWTCPNCHKIYWRGSHYDKILKKVNQLKLNKSY